MVDFTRHRGVFLAARWGGGRGEGGGEVKVVVGGVGFGAAGLAVVVVGVDRFVGARTQVVVGLVVSSV